MNEGAAYTSFNGAVFVQYFDGGPVYPLGECISVDALPNPQMGLTPEFCFEDGEFKPIAELRTAPALPAFTVTALVGSAADYLELVKERKCRFNLYVTETKCGDKHVFSNRQRAWAYKNCRITDDPVNTPVNRNTETMLEKPYAITGWNYRIDHRPLTVTRIATVETAALNFIGSADPRCAGPCGAAREICEQLAACADTVAAAIPDVLISGDSGNTWISPASGFAAGTSIMSGAVLEINDTTERQIFVRGTLAGTALQVEYSDDGLATWTQVDVGAVLAEATNDGGAMYFVPDTIIGYICTNGGRVYKTTDGGQTWAHQATALAASGAASLNAIHFSDELVGYAVGDGDVVIATVDGGVNWAAATPTGSGDDLLDLHVFGQQRVIVGTDNSVGAGVPLYMTYDATANWTAMNTGLEAAITDTVPCVEFLPDGLTGYLIKNTVAPLGAVYKSVDGGWSWRLWTTPANSGLNWIHICKENQAYTVGEVNAATSYIARVNG